MFSRSCNDVCAIHTEKVHRDRCKFRKSGVEQPDRTAKRAALHVVISGGELDQTLEKRLFVTARSEPETLPRFMRVPELPRVEELEALEQG